MSVKFTGTTNCLHELTGEFARGMTSLFHVPASETVAYLLFDFNFNVGECGKSPVWSMVIARRVGTFTLRH